MRKVGWWLCRENIVEGRIEEAIQYLGDNPEPPDMEIVPPSVISWWDGEKWTLGPED